MSVMERWMRVPLRSGLATAVAGSVLGGVMMLAPDGTAATAQVGTPRSSTATATAECTRSNLSATYKGGDAAMSHVYGRIVLRNTSEETCWVKGYGGLSYVGGGNGTQIGAAADRTPSATPKVTLEPGDKVRSAIVETSTGPYSQGQCRPAKVDGFRVYVPDETRSIFVKHPTTGCANPKIHLLAHKAYH
jgi:Protein of unknown function (DUF4232)